MKLSFVFFVLAASAVLSGAVDTSEPVWMSPKNVTNLSDAELYYEKGVWATVDIGAGIRGTNPGVVMDSKGTLWIMFGVLDETNAQNQVYEVYLYTVWNYNPKTDQYRYVWSTNQTNPRNPGQLGIPSETNFPGGIRFTQATIDSNDNIWFTTLGELWMFNTTTWLFTRMHGMLGQTNTMSPGANPGQPGTDVWPGATESPCLLTDSQDQIWLLAGLKASVYSNTVWMFNSTSLLWTFAGGNVVPTAGTYPGALRAACFMDENDRAWLYGGTALNEKKNLGSFGSIWTFDTRVKRTWELEYGNNTFKATAKVVSVDFHPDNQPPASEGSIFVDRLDGTAMLVVGSGYSNTIEISATDMVWLYSKSLKQWKLVHGNSSAINTPSAFTHYRQPGSTMPSRAYFGQINGKNFNGDVYIVGGTSPFPVYVNFTYSSDIWLIPNNHCINTTCDTHATCVTQLFDYTCQCNDGFTGDGFTCAAVVPPTSNEPMGNSPPSNSPLPSPTTATPSISPVTETPNQHSLTTSNAMVVTASMTILLLISLVL